MLSVTILCAAAPLKNAECLTVSFVLFQIMSRFLLQQMSPLCLTVAILLAYAVASATAKHAESKTQNQQVSLFRLWNLGRTTVELGSAEHFAVLSSKQTQVDAMQWKINFQHKIH